MIFFNWDAFDSVDRTVLFCRLHRNDIPKKFAEFLPAFFLHNYGRLTVQCELANPLETTSAVNQECPISPYFVKVREDALDLQDVAVDLTNEDVTWIMRTSLCDCVNLRNMRNVHNMDFPVRHVPCASEV